MKDAIFILGMLIFFEHQRPLPRAGWQYRDVN